MEPAHYTSFVPRRNFIRQAACAAIGTRAIRNILHDLRLMNAAVAQGPANDYKALVCVFLAGGNDSNNLILPTATGEYDSYALARSPVLAIPRATILNLDAANGAAPLNPDGHGYGLHPACPHLRTLFGETKLATVFNVGNLAYPITRAQYTANPRMVGIPLQLFSHSDQVTQWQTSLSGQISTTGWGGRCADLLEATYNGINPAVSLSVSLAGANRLEVGNVVAQYSVSTTGAVNLALPTSNTPGNVDYFGTSSTSARKNELRSIVADSGTDAQKHLQVREYARVLQQGIDVGAVLNAAIAPYADPIDAPGSFGSQTNANTWRWNNDLTGIYKTNVQPNGLGGFPSTLLGNQLKMVARMIAGRAALGVRRQIFFVSVGGYDTHRDQTDAEFDTSGDNAATGSHANLLSEVNLCLYAFQRAMEQLQSSPNWAGEPATSGVTAFTASDFGRTFRSNGQGSDHGWGGHQLVVGSAVDGRKTFGTWPMLQIDGTDDTSLGRWIPTMSVDQFSGALAQWFGVTGTPTTGDLATVFPNLQRFGPMPALFKV